MMLISLITLQLKLNHLLKKSVRIAYFCPNAISSSFSTKIIMFHINDFKFFYSTLFTEPSGLQLLIVTPCLLG